MATPYRPDLRFDTYEQLLADAQALHTSGWEKSGQWSLAMVCDHLARWINGIVDGGVPRVPGPFQWIARFIIRRMVRRQKYPKLTIHAPGTLKPSIDLSEIDALAALTAAVTRLGQFTGAAVQTNSFGPIDNNDFRGLTLLHAAHHLSFLRVRSGG